MNPVAVAPFQLQFLLLLVAGGVYIWIPSFDATVMQIDCNAAIAIAPGNSVAYPSGHGQFGPSLFYSSQAGIYQCSFPVLTNGIYSIAAPAQAAFNASVAYTTSPL